MHDPVVVRLVRFTSARPGFDVALRSTLMPNLCQRAGVIAAWAGRQGPDEVGERTIISVWTTEDAMDTAFRDDEPAAEVGAAFEISHADVEVLPVRAHRVGLRPLHAGILRVARGRVSDVGTDDLTDRVLEDLESAEQRGAAPGDLVVAGDGTAFVMVSTWPGWSAIEAATGASISEPLRSKRATRLLDFQVDHFELVVAPDAEL